MVVIDFTRWGVTDAIHLTQWFGECHGLAFRCGDAPDSDAVWVHTTAIARDVDELDKLSLFTLACR